MNTSGYMIREIRREIVHSDNIMNMMEVKKNPATFDMDVDAKNV
jgi:hypothetical protein